MYQIVFWSFHKQAIILFQCLGGPVGHPWHHGRLHQDQHNQDRHEAVTSSPKQNDETGNKSRLQNSDFPATETNWKTQCTSNGGKQHSSTSVQHKDITATKIPSRKTVFTTKSRIQTITGQGKLLLPG